MSVGRRVRAIQRLTDYLDGLATSDDAEMVLRQYGAALPGHWTHFRNMLLLALEALPDGTLFQMEGDLLAADQPTPVPAAHVPWKVGHVRLFVSHSTQQKADVGQLRDVLANHGIDAFVAHDSIEPTKPWLRVIVAALKTCDALAAWITPEFRQSRWTDQEVGYALQRDIPIVPVKTASLDPHGFIGEFQAVQAVPGNATATADRVMAAMSLHAGLHAAMLDVAVGRFTASISFDEAKTLIKPLHERPWPWTTEVLNRLQQAVADNVQVREAFGVPAKVQSIVDKYAG